MSSDKESMADLLREFPTWGHAAVHYKERVEELSRVLLDAEGSLLAYWTDIPETEVQRLTVLIRQSLGDFEPRRTA